MAERWTLVLLALFVWAPLSDALVNKNDLARFVNDLLNLYKPTYRVHGQPPMFSIAISIPLNAMQRYDFSQVIAADPPQNVRAAMDSCQVYTGNRVVAATLLKYPDFIQQCPNQPVTWNYVTQRCPAVRLWRDFEQCTNNDIKKLKKEVDGLVQHAEYRVLQSIQTLTNRINRGSPALKNTDLMLFYTYKSICYARCSSTDHTFNVLTQLSSSVRRWNNYAVVFSDIFVPAHSRDTADLLERNRRTAIANLGNVLGGAANVYRCTQGASVCIGCSAPGGVNNDCVRPSRSISAPPRGQ